MKKHPGIWFTIFSMVGTFLLSFELSMLEIPRWLLGYLMLLWCGECFIWTIHFHCKWLETLDKKYYRKENQKENK